MVRESVTEEEALRQFLKKNSARNRQGWTLQLGDRSRYRHRTELKTQHTLKTASGPTWPEESLERRPESSNHAGEDLNYYELCFALRTTESLEVPKRDWNKWGQWLWQSVVHGLKWRWAWEVPELQSQQWGRKATTHLNWREASPALVTDECDWKREAQEDSEIHGLHNRKSWTETGNWEWPHLEGEEHLQNNLLLDVLNSR